MHPALGIDYGDARIGIAATDPLGILAHPVETIPAAGDPIARIAELTAQRGIKTLVLGIPLRLDGSEGTAAQKIREFGGRIEERIPGVPLVYVDETLTTVAASQKLHEAGRNTKKQRRVIDQAAAVEILELWLAENPNPMNDHEEHPFY